MANESELIAKPTTTEGTRWLPVIAGSLLSGAVSAGVGYWLGSRPKSTTCGCKSKTPSGNGNGGGEKAA